MNTQLSLRQLGWQPFFQQQLSLQQWQELQAVRIIAQHRAHLDVAGENGVRQIDAPITEDDLSIGDWILIDSLNRFVKRLDRFSYLSRKAPGTKVMRQTIAANIDTLFIVCSLNQDFNLNRIERYLTLANSAGAEPVVVLTKTDLCTDVDDKVAAVQAMSPTLMIEAVNALDSTSVDALSDWCKSGKTIALLGSSGVGKSTLVNTLVGDTSQLTGGIRESDAKGKHTTTARSIHFMSSGGILMDTPGMRELQLADSENGIVETFAEIVELAQQCRFSDCQHQTEPGCAIQQALTTGELDSRRFQNYLKLNKEQQFNSMSLAQKRERDRDLSKYYKKVLNHAHQTKKSS